MAWVTWYSGTAEEVRGIEGREHDGAASLHQHRMESGGATGVEEHRDVLNGRAALGDGDLRQPVQHGCDRVAVRQERALRNACGTARGSELVDVGVVNGGAGIEGGLGGDQLLEIETEPVAGARADDLRHRRELAEPLAGALGHVGVHDDGGRLDVAQIADELVSRQADVGGSADDAALRAAEEEVDVLAAVGREHGDALALSDPEAPECASKPVRASLELAPARDTCTRYDDGLTLAEVLGVGPYDVADEHLYLPWPKEPPRRILT